LFRARLNSDREKDERRRYDERHWTEKKLEEMADRDWRIFKEDYNITTRGGNIPHPLRYWEEAGLEKGIIDVIKLAGYKVIQIFKTIFLITSDFFSIGTNTYSTTSYTNWFTKSRCYWYCRNWFW